MSRDKISSNTYEIHDWSKMKHGSTFRKIYLTFAINSFVWLRVLMLHIQTLLEGCVEHIFQFVWIYLHILSCNFLKSRSQSFLFRGINFLLFGDLFIGNRNRKDMNNSVDKACKNKFLSIWI